MLGFGYDVGQRWITDLVLWQAAMCCRVMWEAGETSILSVYFCQIPYCWATMVEAIPSVVVVKFNDILAFVYMRTSSPG